MSWVDIVRVTVLAWVFFSSLIAMALAANLTSITESLVKQYFTWAALAIAVGVVSLLSIPVMLALDAARTRAFTSLIIFELSWLSVLQILWLVVGAMAASGIKQWGGQCDFTFNSEINTACKENSAIAAFGFLAWLPLLGYTILLLILALIRHNKGAPVWLSTVKDAFRYGVNTPSASGPTTAPQYGVMQGKDVDSSVASLIPYGQA